MSAQNPYTLKPQGEDRLGVLSTTARVVRETPWVKINTNAIDAFADRHKNAPMPEHQEETFHCAFLPPRRFVNFLLLLEALNFSFWDDEPRWRVNWDGGSHDGYWALAAALHRGVVRDALPLWDAHWMAQLQLDELEALLAGGEGNRNDEALKPCKPVPMLPERLAHVREVGAVLLKDWQGQAFNLLAHSGYDAPALALLVEQSFSSFRDVAQWPPGSDPLHRKQQPQQQTHTVRILKRAQIFCADLARLYPRLPGGTLTGLTELTAFADYKVPQVLRKNGVLEYSPQLAARIAAGEVLLAGCEEEVSIRAATIWACEWIARALNNLRGAKGPAKALRATAADVDYLLWSAGQDKAGLLPYHLTRTPFY